MLWTSAALQAPRLGKGGLVACVRDDPARELLEELLSAHVRSVCPLVNQWAASRVLRLATRPRRAPAPTDLTADLASTCHQPLLVLFPLPELSLPPSVPGACVFIVFSSVNSH